MLPCNMIHTLTDVICCCTHSVIVRRRPVITGVTLQRRGPLNHRRPTVPLLNLSIPGNSGSILKHTHTQEFGHGLISYKGPVD